MDHERLPPWLNRYGLFGIICLGVFLYFLLLREYLLNSPYALIPIVDAGNYWDIALDVAHRGKGLPSTIFSGPLYALFLAAIVSIFGPELGAVYAVQGAMAIITAIMVFYLCRQLFSSAHGFIAGLLSLLYLPFVYFSTKLLPDAFAVFLLTSFLLIYTHPKLPQRPAGLVLLGITGGLCVLARSQFLPVILGLVVLLHFYRKDRVPGKLRRWRVVLAFAAVLLPLAPFGAYNYSNTGSFFITTPNGGLTFYTGNNPRATGCYSHVPGISDDQRHQLRDMVRVASADLGRQVGVWEADRYFWAKGLEFIGSNPAAWLGLELEKLRLILTPRETFAIYNLYLERSLFLPALYLFPVTWGILLPLSVIGLGEIVFSRRKVLGDILPLLVTGAVLSAVLLAFLVISRYRLYLFPVAVVLAAHGVFSLATWWKKRRFIPAVAGTAILLAGVSNAALARYPVSPGAWNNLGIVMLRLNKFSDAEVIFRRALNKDPDSPVVINNLINALLNQDKIEEARPLIERLAKHPEHQYQQRVKIYRELIRKGRGASSEGLAPKGSE